MNIKTAMLLAAGFGTRMQPLTLTIPKALIEVNGITLLERNIRYLKSFGIEEIIINVHHFAQQIIDFLEQKEHFGIKIHISDETDAILETGGGLQRAECFLRDKEDFVLMNVDILTNLDLSKMEAYHHKVGTAYCPVPTLATLAVSERVSSRKLLFDQEMTLQGWRGEGETRLIQETSKELQALAFSGVHIISPSIFDLIEMRGKFSIIVAYLALAKTYPIYGYDHTGDLLIDVGRPSAIEKAVKLFG